MLSILTNFGCHFGCSYCVYRENGINIPKTNYKTFGWNELEEELKKHEGELVSISGGGDPLYNYARKEDTVKFYDKLFKLVEKYDCKLELHTSIIDPKFDYSKFERTVFHLTMPNQMKSINSINVPKLSKINRVVYVVQEHYSKLLVTLIVNELFLNKEIEELSFRQMIDKDGKATYYLHDYLKEGHNGYWYYIEQCDYNEYFVQDHIEKEYLEIR